MSIRQKIIVLSVLVILGLVPWTKTTTATISNAPEEEVKTKAKDLPEVLFKIALCESDNRQFDFSGKVVLGKVNPLDRGRFQINTRWNGAEAKKLGYDLDTWEGNTAMALHLYKSQGTKPWLWSKPCWNRPLPLILKEKGL